MTLKEIIKWLKKWAQDLKTNSVALGVALSKRETPLLAKVLITLSLLYLLSPIDLIPDFIPVLGVLDDLIIAPLLFSLALKLIPRALWEECQEEALKQEGQGLTRKWVYALPLLLIWGIVFYFFVKKFFLN